MLGLWNMLYENVAKDKNLCHICPWSVKHLDSMLDKDFYAMLSL